MSNFTRVKPLGWALNEVLTSAQMNALDQNNAASVNGDGGGSYDGAIEWNGTQQFTEQVQLNGADILVQGQDFAAVVATPAGIGGTDGYDALIRASNGQAQTSTNDNNNGGHVHLVPGVAGVGGSGNAGYQGMTRMAMPGHPLTSDVEGVWTLSGSLLVPASTTTRLYTPPIFGVTASQERIIGAELTTYTVQPDTDTGSIERDLASFRVDQNTVTLIAASPKIGDQDEHSSGFATALNLLGSPPTGSFTYQFQNGSASIALRCVYTLRLTVGPPYEII